jgi:TrkA domain protein
MVDVKRVKLPGVGVLHTFVTDGGGKVGVITHRAGSSDLITFSDAEDGSKATKVALRLDDDEAHTLAELLGGTRITESLTNLDSIPGLTIDWFHVD